LSKVAIGKAGFAIASTVVITVLLAGVFIGIHYNTGASPTSTNASTTSTTCTNSVIYPLGDIKFQPNNSTNDAIPNLPIMFYNRSVSGYPQYTDGLTFADAPFTTLSGGVINGELTTNKNVDFFLINNGASGHAGQVLLNQNFATDIKLDVSVNSSNFSFILFLQHDYSLDSPQPLVVDVTQAITLCAIG